jgi:UDP-N-acetylmuramyl pentapeptide phosphotransferase/UDP-N-acetylglucosamine-1-phosphate transferase
MALAVGTVTGLAISNQLDTNVTVAIALALGLGAVGLTDDFVDLSVGRRLFWQLALGSMTAAILVPGILTLVGMLLSALAVIWIVTYTNFFNFMDGINGIAMSQLVVAGGTWLYLGITQFDETNLTLLGVVTVGAAAGFAPWNVPNARIFLGDVGSYFGGAWIAGGTIIAIALGVHPVVAVSPTILFLADPTLAILKKIRSGMRWDAPHSFHVYQRLVRLGWSHAAVALLYAALSTVIVGLALTLEGAGSLEQGIAALGMAGVLIFYLTIPNLTAPRRVLQVDE